MATKDKSEWDYTNILIPLLIVTRFAHDQMWISFSRYQTARGKNRIVDKSIEFEQVDRESTWDDQILFNGILFYLGNKYLPNAQNLPLWRTDGIIITILLHAGPVEFLYYWLHRALHHHFLYSRYHSHHHSSIVTEPITSVIHPFGEHIAYFLLFAIPLLSIVLTGTASLVAFAGYITYLDLMNNMGHCNFEFFPKWLFRVFPFIKYIMYTPSYHSLHHTQFRTNYSLFMPIYDLMYGTMDKATDSLHESSLGRIDNSPDVVYLTHPTTLDSVYHLHVGIGPFASDPYKSKWATWVLWPLTLWSMLLTWVSGQSFVVERNIFNHLKMQTWAIPRYRFQYLLSWQKEKINKIIEEAILEADEAGVKVMSLGLLNQGEDLNGNGELYVRKHPNLKVRLVDGSSLAAAVVVNSIPNGIKQVLLRGNLSKVAYAVANELCKKGVQVAVPSKEVYEKLKERVSSEFASNLILSTIYDQEVWLVGDGLSDEEQKKAPKNTIFIPFSQFPPNRLHKNRIYYSTPAFFVPKALENIDSCENWLPRRVMSAWRVAGIVHALEEWGTNECGETMFDIDKIWSAALRHGFRPFNVSS
ncbi:Very-long-chain aldehyde decarbonylase gl1-5 [Thalictrum thalictroides]|uniref:Very-long-chain aldehyde decarbonylase gl1-5 n=1 Tax=Thalictrum thalictroides TaxID=46969 RepID=A0A7J6VPG0_THATH|nr:Very-long-chain aldehyde decarbonylase gl1-5 [Thalictrum thalictroides]